MDNRRWILLAATAAVLLLGGAAWMFREPPPPDEIAEEVSPEETGLSPEAQEELMRTIGYVQQ